MTDEQKAQALALYDMLWRTTLLNRCPLVSVPVVSLSGRELRAPVPDLADTTGATEGVLHRALEALVGEPVEVQCIGGRGDRWRARGAVDDGGDWALPETSPTRLDAIVAAILAVGVTK